MSNDAPAYLITFRTYGTWLHGDDRGSTDRDHHGWDEPHLPADAHRRNIAYSRLVSPPVTLAGDQRNAVRGEIHRQCQHRDWMLHAINVRTEHVHTVVSASEPPERVLATFKSYSTRALRRAGLGMQSSSPWSRHGSTRYLWSADSLSRACVYVADLQDVRPATGEVPVDPLGSVPRPRGSGGP